MPPRFALSIPLLVLAQAAAATPQQAADDCWPQWRGPALDGSSSATGLPAEWSAEKNVLWRSALPSWSGATPVLWGGRIFVVSPAPAEARPAEAQAEEERGEGEEGRRGRGRRGGRGQGRDPGGQDLLLLCFDTADGELLWERVVDRGNALHMKANDASCSPVTDGEHVWVLTGNGVVSALTMEGEEVWQRRLQEDYGEFGLNWGYGSSPLLEDGMLVVPVLHGMHTDEPSYLLALDAKTGETRWKVERPTDAPRESPDAYTTPLVLGEGEARSIVVSGGDYVTGHDPATGAELWRVAGLNPRKAPNYRIVASPVLAGDLVVAPTRERPLLAIALGEDRRPAEEPIAWRWEGQGAPDVPTPTTDGEHLYLVSDNGMVTCVDLESGEAVWGPERTAQGTVSASPLLADGKLFVTNEEGVTVVLAAGPRFEQLAVNELDGSYTLSSPIACGERLYLRTGDFLYCIAAAAEPPR